MVATDSKVDRLNKYADPRCLFWLEEDGLLLVKLPDQTIEVCEAYVDLGSGRFQPILLERKWSNAGFNSFGYRRSSL